MRIGIHRLSGKLFCYGTISGRDLDADELFLFKSRVEQCAMFAQMGEGNG